MELEREKSNLYRSHDPQSIEPELGSDLDAAHIEGDDAFTDRELLEYIAGMLRRLEPLIDVLEQAAPVLATVAPSNGAKPSPLKLAMAASKLARNR